VEVEERFQRREYDENADDYHLYITNLSQEGFLPGDIATLYRCRWEMELLFRELKTQYEQGTYRGDPGVCGVVVAVSES
jgi:putative transposase